MDFNTFDQEQILSLLDIQNDGSIVIEGIEVIDNIKFVHISKKLEPVYCPKCMCRMHSKGIYTRKVNHHIMQDTMKLFLMVKQRKWYCKHCGLYLNDQFAFLERYSHSSNIVHLLILEMMKDLSVSAAYVARQFHISDTQVHDIFNAYVNLPGFLFLNTFLWMRSSWISVKKIDSLSSSWIFPMGRSLTSCIIAGDPL